MAVSSWKSSVRMLAPALGLVLLATCSKSSSSPSSQSLTDFATGLQTTDGTSTATATSHGSPPAASGGPAATVTASGTSSSATVINGGSSLVHVRASAP